MTKELKLTKILTKEDIDKVNDLPIDLFPVPEWEGLLPMRGMKGNERDVFETKFSGLASGEKLDTKGLRAELCSYCIVNPETGERLYTGKEVQKLGEKSAAALDRVFAHAQKLSGLTDKDVEELEGN